MELGTLNARIIVACIENILSQNACYCVKMFKISPDSAIDSSSEHVRNEKKEGSVRTKRLDMQCL